MLKLPKFTKTYIVVPEGKLALPLTFNTRTNARMYRKALKCSTAQIESKIVVIEKDDQGLEYDRREVK